MIRIIHLVVVCAFVAAAAWVYKIKFDATVQAERIAVIRNEIKRERDTIASLRAEWSRLDSPPRIQDLAKRHLALKPLDATQYDTLDKLPERPKPIVPMGTQDPIAGIIENTDSEAPTGSIPAGDQQAAQQSLDTQPSDAQPSNAQPSNAQQSGEQQ